MKPVLLIACALMACANRARPTVTGAELYAQVTVLQTAGQATIGAVTVRKDQVLTTGSEGQAFWVTQVIEKCRGGDPAADVDCTLALLLEQRFFVLDRMPQGRPPVREKEDRTGSFLSSAVVIGLATAAVGGLAYGAATCDFPGCKAVFGVPLVLIGTAALVILVSF
ncbi:MAG TPA: hypothetical protein VIU61_23255 [Kofleriaceae bacterium]